MAKSSIKKNMQQCQTTLFVFGATGDLAVKKIFPALEALRKEGALDILGCVKVVAVSRRDWDDAGFAAFLREKEGQKYPQEFWDLVSYAKVDIDHGIGYDGLSKHVVGEPVAYLSLAPRYYRQAIEGLRDAGVLSRGKGKLMVEKPFGTNESTAIELNKLILGFLDESQIYRIDHYLGKETLLALMKLHEESLGLDELLTSEHVEEIKVAIFEKDGIHGRGASYDGVGAFRDVGQNHLLAMLSVIAADVGGVGERDGKAPGAWQAARAEVISRLAPPAKTCAQSRRGQYQGYLGEVGVGAESETETAFEEVTSLLGGKLSGVPLILAAGKKMPASEAFVEIDFKDMPDLPRKIVCRIQPDQRVVLVNRDGSHQVFDIPKMRDAYGNVIAAALAGRTEDFVGADEVQALWRYADRVVECWKKSPLEIYGDDRPFLVE